MLFAPGLVITASCFGGYAYWKFCFRQVTNAIRMESAGRYDEARTLLRAFLENRNPVTNRGEAKWRCRLLLARLERKLGHYDAAFREANELASAPCSEGIRLAALQLSADALAWGGELDAALQIADQAYDLAERQRLSSFLGEITGLKARILTWQGNLEAARELSEALLKRSGPPALYAHLRLSEIERVSGNFHRAIEWAHSLTERLKASDEGDRRVRVILWTALAHYHAARAAWLAGNPAQAAEFLLLPDGARQLPRADAVGWWGLRAAVSEELGDKAAANEYLEAMTGAANRAAPGFGARAWQCYYQGRIQLMRGDLKGAENNLVEAIRSMPPGDARAEMCYWLGNCLEQSRKGNPEGAYRCGASSPEEFYFARLCREKLSAAEFPLPQPATALAAGPAGFGTG